MPRHPSPQAVAALDLPPDWRLRIGSAIRSRRRSIGWTRDRLAAAAGYSRNHVTKIERGEGSLDALVIVCAAMGISPATPIRSAFARNKY